MTKIFIAKQYDIRPVDFQTGKRIAVAENEKKTCACCGKKIVKVSELNNGDLIGSECAVNVQFVNPNLPEMGLKNFGLSQKQLDYFSKAIAK